MPLKSHFASNCHELKRKKCTITNEFAFRRGNQAGMARRRGKYICTLYEEDSSMEAYCMKCKQKREVKDPQPVTMKNGKPATTGTCGTCGTKLFKIGKSS